MSADRTFVAHNNQRAKRVDQKGISNTSGSGTPSLFARTERTCTDLSRTDTPTYSRRFSQRDTTSEHIRPQHTHHSQHEVLQHLPVNSYVPDDHPVSPADEPHFASPFCTQQASRLHQYMPDNDHYEHQQNPEAFLTSPVGRSRRGEHMPVTGLSSPANRRSSRTRKQRSPRGKSAGLRGHSSDQYDSGTLIPAGKVNSNQPDMHTMPRDLNGQDTQILYRFPGHGKPDDPSVEGERECQSPRDREARANGAQGRAVSGLLAQQLCRGHSGSPPVVPGTPGRHHSPAQRAFKQHTVYIDDYQQPMNDADTQDRRRSRRTGETRASSRRRTSSRKHAVEDEPNTHRARHTQRGNANTAPLQRAHGSSPLGDAQLEGLAASPTYSGGIVHQPEESPYGSPHMNGGTDSPHLRAGRRDRGMRESPTEKAVKNAVAEGIEAHRRGGSARAGRHSMEHQPPQELTNEFVGAEDERLSLEDSAQRGNGHFRHRDFMAKRYAIGAQETEKREQWYREPHGARHTVAIEATDLHAAHDNAHPGANSPMHGHHHERAHTTTLARGDAMYEQHSPQSPHRDSRRRELRHAHTQPLRRTRQPPAPGAKVLSPKGTDQERSHTAPLRHNLQNDQEASHPVVRAAHANAAPAHLPWHAHTDLPEGRVHGGQGVPLPFRNEAAGATVTEQDLRHARHERAGQNVEEDSLPRRAAHESAQERAHARERSHTQVQNDREASTGWEPSNHGRAHTEHFQKFQEAPDHARGVSPRRRRTSQTPRAGEEHLLHPNLPQWDRPQQHQAPNVQQWERQQHQVQEWDQRKWQIQEQQRQLARKNREKHAHTVEPAAINHNHAQQAGARGPSTERQQRGANPVPGVAAQAGHLQPDAVLQQPVDNTGCMLKPLTDKHKQFEDIRTFLGNAPAATEFIDVRDFVMQLGGGVHEHYRENADAENWRRHQAMNMDCSHTFDASAGAACDMNVHDSHAHRMAPLVEASNEDALSVANASPHQGHAHMPTQVAVAQQMADARQQIVDAQEAAPTHQHRNRGVAPTAHNNAQYQEERAARRANRQRAQTETVRRHAHADEAATVTQRDVHKELAAAHKRAQRAAQVADPAAARDQAAQEAALEGRAAMRQEQIERSRIVQRTQQKNSNAVPRRWAQTEEAARGNSAETERRRERKSKSKVHHTEFIHREDEHERGGHSDHLHRNGAHTEVKKTRSSNRHRSTRRSDSMQPSSPAATARQPPLPGVGAPLDVPERPDSPPPQATRSPPHFIPPRCESPPPPGASPTPSHQLGTSPAWRQSSPQQIPVNVQELHRRMRRSSRAMSGASSDKMGWTVELSGSSIPTGGSPHTGGWMNRELEPEHRRRARAHTRGISGSPTEYDRNQHFARQPPAQQNSPVLQAALAEYCRGGSSNGNSRPQIIAPGPFGGPASPPDGYEFRTMQDRMAAANTANAQESEQNPKAVPIPKRRPPGYFDGQMDELYINGEFRGGRH